LVEVTGIADGVSGLKEVQFTWKYEGLPDVVARYTGQGTQPHSGTSVVRLYDDGWRVEGLHLLENARVPFPGFPQEVLKTIQDAERFKKELLRLTTTPSREISKRTFKYAMAYDGSNPSFFQLTITDVDVQCAYWRQGDQRSFKNTIPYGDMGPEPVLLSQHEAKGLTLDVVPSKPGEGLIEISQWKDDPHRPRGDIEGLEGASREILSSNARWRLYRSCLEKAQEEKNWERFNACAR